MQISSRFTIAVHVLICIETFKSNQKILLKRTVRRMQRFRTKGCSIASSHIVNRFMNGFMFEMALSAGNDC